MVSINTSKLYRYFSALDYFIEIILHCYLLCSLKLKQSLLFGTVLYVNKLYYMLINLYSFNTSDV